MNSWPVFVDVSDTLQQKVILAVASRTDEHRAFSIKITQLADNLAPQNCLQYHEKSEGFIQTFNYDDVSKIVQVRQPSYFVSESWLTFRKIDSLFNHLQDSILSLNLLLIVPKHLKNFSLFTRIKTMYYNTTNISYYCSPIEWSKKCRYRIISIMRFALKEIKDIVRLLTRMILRDEMIYLSWLISMKMGFQ